MSSLQNLIVSKVHDFIAISSDLFPLRRSKQFDLYRAVPKSSRNDIQLLFQSFINHATRRRVNIHFPGSFHRIANHDDYGFRSKLVHFRIEPPRLSSWPKDVSWTFKAHDERMVRVSKREAAKFCRW